MEKDLLAGIIILFFLTFNLGLFYGDDVVERFQDRSSPEQSGPEHEHALFYVIVDGEKMSFLEQRYQLAREDVHLENNRSDIVHKHRRGVKWSTFLNSINVTYNQTNETLCLDAKNISRCDNGTVLLNNKSADPSKEIEQGDNFVIALGENYTEEARKSSRKEVPRPWQDPATYGRKI